MAKRGTGHQGGKGLRHLLILAVVALAFLLLFLYLPLAQKLQIPRFDDFMFRATNAGGILVFPGTMNSSALGVTEEERSKILRFLQENAPTVKRVEVWATQQDAYAELRGNSELSVNVVVFMEDGTVLKPPTTPLTRKELADKLIWRMRRDLEAYNKAAVKGGVGKDVIITNVL
ncbi:MAG TPA: hypothetical protein DD766_05010 [Desulfovibrio sp.]|jgi:hypothetical protein|nr:hypothetical protein [Desulfovibrio sp.]